MASSSSRLALFIALSALPSCEEAEVPVAASVPALEAVAVPSHLDFGEVDQGVAYTLSASVQNVGERAGEVVQVTSATGGLSTDLLPGTPLPANGFVGFSVGWLPGSGATLDDTLTVRVADSAGTESTISVPVSGHATGPAAVVTTDTLDVGTVGVGCSASAWLTVENLGNDVLRVEDIALTADREFQIGDIDGEALALPWALAPGGSQNARITYTPTADATQTAHVALTTNDVYSPTIELEFAGRGEMEWMSQDEAVEEQAVAAIVVANEQLLNLYREPFYAALPGFFEALIAREVPFRIAFTMNGEGKVNGDLPYIDESVSPAEASDLVPAMLGDVTGFDNDMLLQSFLSAVAENRSWLIDESPTWAASQLNFVGINDDQEQSSLNARAFVEDAAVYKAGETGMITVHAIAGDSPLGCGSAAAAGELYEATVYTGGTFASICDSDWGPNLVALAEGMPGSNAYLFVLDETPVQGSLTVSVNSVPVESGWSYSRETNTVLFEEGSRPETGSIVTLEYAKVCEGA